MEIATIGPDLAKHVFQLHGVDQQGHAVVRQRLRRGQVIGFFAKLPPCLVGMEACGTAHHRARAIRALGHDARLMPARYVKACVKRDKNDAADAEAICEAVTRPSVRLVPIKTEAQQAVLVLHRARELLAGQRTQTVNALRGHLAGFGVIEPQGIWRLGRPRAHLEQDVGPEPGRAILGLPALQLDELENRTAAIGAEILARHRANPASRRLAKIPGIGPLIATAIAATAIAATVPDATVFRSGREFAAWLGLVPRQRSTGGKQRAGRISRQGDRYLRRLLVIGAQSALPRSEAVRESAWIRGLLSRCARRAARGARWRSPPGRQDRPHRLGDDGQRRGLPAGCSSVSRRQPSTSCLREEAA